jgi:hypothetical protein
VWSSVDVGVAVFQPDQVLLAVAAVLKRAVRDAADAGGAGAGAGAIGGLRLVRIEAGWGFLRWGVIEFDPETLAARLHPYRGMAWHLQSFWDSVASRTPALAMYHLRILASRLRPGQTWSFGGDWVRFLDDPKYLPRGVRKRPMPRVEPPMLPGRPDLVRAPRF